MWHPAVSRVWQQLSEPDYSRQLPILPETGSGGEIFFPPRNERFFTYRAAVMSHWCKPRHGSGLCRRYTAEFQHFYESRAIDTRRMPGVASSTRLSIRCSSPLIWISNYALKQLSIFPSSALTPCFCRAESRAENRLRASSIWHPRTEKALKA